MAKIPKESSNGKLKTTFKENQDLLFLRNILKEVEKIEKVLKIHIADKEKSMKQ